MLLELLTQAAWAAAVVLLALAAVRLVQHALWCRGFEGVLAAPASPWAHVSLVGPIVQGMRRGDIMAPLLDAAKGGPVTAVWIMGQPLVFVTSLELMKSIVQSGINGYNSPHTFVRSERQVSQMREVFGKSLLFTQGKDWRWRRNTIMPFFQPRVLNRVAEPAVALFTTELLRTLRTTAAASTGGVTVLDVDGIFVELTCKIITAILLGADFDWTRTPVGSARHAVECVTRINDVAIGRQSVGALQVPFMASNAERYKALLTASLAPVVKQIRVNLASASSSSETDCLLEHLARNNEFTDENLVNEAIAMLLAGTETTAHTMSFALHELSKQPALLQRLHDEAVQVFGDADDSGAAVDLSASHLAKLSYAGCVFKETLRLYPSVGMMIVRAIQPAQLGEHLIPAGTDVILNVRGILRDENQFPVPEAFRPERWSLNTEDVLDGAKQAIPEVWFNLGAHQCAGRALALTEAKAVLALIAREFAVEPCEKDYRPVLVNNGLVKPKAGLTVALRLRRRV